MNGTVSDSDATVKKKMNELEREMCVLQDDLSKLQARKRIAQMDANFGEFLHHNIRFCLEHLGKTPPDTQKSLLKALIKKIEVFDDTIALHMFISDPIEDIMPSTEILENALKQQNPTQKDEVMAPEGAVSPVGQKWGGRRDSVTTSHSSGMFLRNLPSTV